MTEDEMREIVLGFPGVEEGTSYGRPSFKVNGKFLTRLRDVGRERAALWLNDSFDKIGVDSTADLDAYL